MTRRTLISFIVGLVCAVALGAIPAHAGILFTYNGFASTAGLTLIGNTTTAVTGDGTVLRVTSAAGGEAGAAYSTTAVPLGAGATFSTVFKFRFTNAGGIDPADGITFVVAANPSGLGVGGGGIGYQGASANSMAIEFDTFNNGAGDGNSSNHVGVDTGGSLQDLGLANVYGVQTCDFSAGNPHTAPGCMSNGDLWTVTISYDGANLSAVLSDPAEGSSFTALNNFPINIATILGTNTAFVGFTSGTGAGFENHDIIYWQMANTAQIGAVPEPATLLLLGTGLLGLGWFARRRARSA